MDDRSINVAFMEDGDNEEEDNNIDMCEFLLCVCSFLINLNIVLSLGPVNPETMNEDVGK